MNFQQRLDDLLDECSSYDWANTDYDRIETDIKDTAIDHIKAKKQELGL